MAGQRKERNELIKLIETYREYQPQEGIPVLTAVALNDVRTVKLQPWECKDSKGAFIKLFDTGDGTHKDQREGGAQIEYRDEAPAIHAPWEDELARNDIRCRMGDIHPNCTAH